MRKLPDHLLDLAQNAIDAGATLIEIAIRVEDDGIIVKVADNGCGMDEEIKKSCLQPHFSTKGTNGLGLALFNEDCNGMATVRSKSNEGTEIVGKLLIANDKASLPKDIADAIAPILDDKFDITLSVDIDGRNYTFDTRALKRELKDVSLHNACVIVAVKRIINENISEIGGAKL